MKKEPVLIMTSVLAGLQVLVGGTALADIIDPKMAALLSLLVAALTMGWGTYTRGVVSPTEAVAAVEEEHADELVAGPAAEGIPEGFPVEVKPEVKRGGGQ